MQVYSPTRSHGAIVIDGKYVADTLQCCHCGAHEEIHPGSGKKRAWCFLCDNKGAFVCGGQDCMVHIPFMAKLDYADARQAFDRREIEKLEKKYPLIGTITL